MSLNADSAGQAPAYDRIYEQFIREHFRQAHLGKQFVHNLARRFRQGPMTLCSRAIGLWLNRELRQRQWTQQDLADRLGVDRSAVAYWIKGGNIHLLNLVQVLIELGCQWSDLPVPARQELAVAAYLAALPYVREQFDPKGGKHTLDRECFWCLFHLFAEPHWERAMRLRDADLMAWEAERVGRAAAASLGREVAGVDVGFLKRLVAEWGAAWVLCIGQVPRKWTVQ
jgi:transcriptional regulator with XRE-family HTH domain